LRALRPWRFIILESLGICWRSLRIFLPSPDGGPHANEDGTDAGAIVRCVSLEDDARRINASLDIVATKRKLIRGKNAPVHRAQIKRCGRTKCPGHGQRVAEIIDRRRKIRIRRAFELDPELARRRHTSQILDRSRKGDCSAGRDHLCRDGKVLEGEVSGRGCGAHLNNRDAGIRSRKQCSVVRADDQIARQPLAARECDTVELHLTVAVYDRQSGVRPFDALHVAARSVETLEVVQAETEIANELKSASAKFAA